MINIRQRPTNERSKNTATERRGYWENISKTHAGIKSKISTQEIILKQKQQEEKARENELNEVKKEIEIKSKENINSTSKFQA